MYEKKKVELQEIRDKERSASAELSALHNRQSEIKAEVSRAYDFMIQMKAENKAGKRSSGEVKKAEKKYLKLKKEQDELAENIAVAGRIAETVKAEVVQAEKEFKRHTTPFYAEQVRPHFEAIQNAMNTIQREIDNINSYRNKMQRDHVPEHILQGITWKSQPVIRKHNRNGSIEMKNFITKFEL